MSTKSSITSLAALVVAAGLAFTGCSNSSEDASEASPEASEPEVTVTESETVAEQSSQDNEPSTEDNDNDSTPAQNSSAPADDRSTPGADQDTDFPTNALDYADALVVAWGEGDASGMKDFAGPEAVDALKDYGMPGGSGWKQTDSDSGAGSTFVTYENADDGAKVELRVGNEAASNGQPQAVNEAKFTE